MGLCRGVDQLVCVWMCCLCQCIKGCVVVLCRIMLSIMVVMVRVVIMVVLLFFRLCVSVQVRQLMVLMLCMFSQFISRWCGCGMFMLMVVRQIDVGWISVNSSSVIVIVCRFQCLVSVVLVVNIRLVVRMCLSVLLNESVLDIISLIDLVGFSGLLLWLE